MPSAGEAKKLAEQQERERKLREEQERAAAAARERARVQAIQNQIGAIDARITEAENAKHSVNFEKKQIENKKISLSKKYTDITAIKKNGTFEGKKADRLQKRVSQDIQKISRVVMQLNSDLSQYDSQLSHIDTYINDLNNQRNSLVRQL